MKSLILVHFWMFFVLIGLFLRLPMMFRPSRMCLDYTVQLVGWDEVGHYPRTRHQSCWAVIPLSVNCAQMAAIARKQIGLEAKEPYCIQSLETFGTISRMVFSTGKVYSTLRASDKHQSAGIHFWSGARMQWISYEEATAK